MEKLLTIVVPSYNVENTLQGTIKSCLIPDPKWCELLDILIVNDGSTDRTLEIARKFEADNPGIVRVWNKENGGHGSTINVGIEQGYGKYIKVVDGDDWLNPAALSEFLKILSQTDVDAVMTDYYHVFMDTNQYAAIKPCTLPYNEEMSFTNIWEEYNFSMHSITVKTDILRNQPYRIDEHCYYVDIEYETLTALFIKTVTYVDLKLYVYRLQREGQSVSVQGWLKHYPEHEQVGRTLINWYLSPRPEFAGRVGFLERRILCHMGSYYRVGFKFESKARRQFLNSLLQYDAWIHDKAPVLYRNMEKDYIIRYCRITHFSHAAYSGIVYIRKVLKRDNNRRKLDLHNAF